jgi:hypothetical protein
MGSKIYNFVARSVDQAVIRRLLIVVAWLLSQVNLPGVFGGQSGNGHGPSMSFEELEKLKNYLIYVRWPPK